jgi:two-component system, OmpR family, KDP operon response regulator KdpE
VTEAAAPDHRQEILIIESDPRIRRYLKTTLSAEKYRIQEAATASDGITRSAKRPPDAVVLDLDLPGTDALDIIRQIREWNRLLPILVLSERVQERDKIIALDAGADDFLGKPLAVGEFLARLRAALRRKTAIPGDGRSSVFRTGDLEVDLGKRRVMREGIEIRLTRTEYKLLQVLIVHADQVLTHSQLLREVWGPHSGDQAHYVRVYMAQLRLKLEADPARPRYLRTEPGVGYRLMTR